MRGRMTSGRSQEITDMVRSRCMATVKKRSLAFLDENEKVEEQEVGTVEDYRKSTHYRSGLHS